MTGQRPSDVGKAARLLIKRFGRAALSQIDQRIRELREHGEADAASLWLKIKAEAERILDSGDTQRDDKDQTRK
jgi:hypothetical protein